jgi:hypothetical protein
MLYLYAMTKFNSLLPIAILALLSLCAHTLFALQYDIYNTHITQTLPSNLTMADARASNRRRGRAGTIPLRGSRGGLGGGCNAVELRPPREGGSPNLR